MTPARALLPALALCLAAGAAAAAPADTAGVHATLHLGRRDAAFALLATGAIAGAASQDTRWLAQATSNHARAARGLAVNARQLGEPVPMGAALLAADGIARVVHDERVAAASERMAFACVAAGAMSFAIKAAAGRERPDETSSPSRFKAFSGHDAFPSGHATVAFALAASLDAEARSRWLRAIVYPAAAVTAWSRVHDREHWPSDVVAGAALGGWCAYRADRFAQRAWPRGLAFVVLPRWGGAGFRIARSF